jgi:alpha-beta hydrolase superfamily lysophospholipase
MRWIFALPLMLSAAACNAKPTDESSHKPGTVWTVVAGQLVTLTASDGVKVFGAFQHADHPKALILLFHQAGSSKDEYATLAPWLAQNGYSSLAIDQRSGGGLYGDNLTVHGLGKSADYLQAQKDLKAALDWGRKQKLPIILWGSSYSSALIFPLAASEPQGIVALLSFSPGEYFDSDKQMVRTAAAKIAVPVFLASTKEEGSDADPIFAALPKNPADVRFVPEYGVHGSSMLIAKRNPQGAEDNVRAVLAFLDRVTAAK